MQLLERDPRQLDGFEICRRIQEARERAGLSQRQAVDGLAYTNAYLSRIEAHQRVPSHAFLVAIAARLAVSVAWLETGEDEVDVRISREDAKQLLEDLAGDERAYAIDLARRVDVALGSRRCADCGCTEHVACPGGCSWSPLDPDVCSNCLPILGGVL